MNHRLRGLAVALLGALAVGSQARAATQEMTIPLGTAVDILVEDALSSRTAKVGDVFRAVLVRALWIDGQLAFPQGAVVEGRVDVVKSRASGARSGFVGVKFVSIERADAQADTVAGRLREFGARPERVDVVLVGRVVADDPRMAEPVEDGDATEAARYRAVETDVEVAAGTLVSLQFGERLDLRAATSNLPAPGQGVPILLSLETISAAQRALREQARYQGPIDGVMNTETRQAVIQFQLHRGRVASGDLDTETLRLLGITAVPR